MAKHKNSSAERSISGSMSLLRYPQEMWIVHPNYRPSDLNLEVYLGAVPGNRIHQIA